MRGAFEKCPHAVIPAKAGMTINNICEEIQRYRGVYYKIILSIFRRWT
jgi:hypothetical protein